VQEAETPALWFFPLFLSTDGHTTGQTMGFARAVRQLLSRRSLRLIAACVACFSLLEIPKTAWAGTPSDAYLRALESAFQKHLQEDQDEISKSQSLLASARAAHDQAVAENDADGASITAQAISTAEQALECGSVRTACQ
jgi:hypothetical protein